MKKLLNAAENNIETILNTEQYVWQNPETGFREVKTSQYLAEIMKKMGYELVFAGNIPGFYTTIDTGRPGPTLLILGEMDSVLCPQHKSCDTHTGAVHACGHHIQCASLIGIAAALKEPGVLDDLSGKIKLCAIPAEELLEIEYRSELKSKGIIRYFSGKSEFLYRGYFDDVDLAFMVHASTVFAVETGAVGCVTKKIIYKGKASHAGGNPWDGINALYAANCGLNAVNAIRETFQEKDIVRVHPIITNGGTMVNAVPERVTLESYVRGVTFDGIVESNKKVNRALSGGAISLGANIEIIDFPGYAPLINDKNLIEVAKEAALLAVADKNFFVYNTVSSGSTDMGDLSCVMPVVHPFVPGVTGRLHGSDFKITDPKDICLTSVKLQLGMLFILLSNNAERASKVVEEANLLFRNKQDYFSFLDTMECYGDRITYLEEDTVKLKLC